MIKEEIKSEALWVSALLRSIAKQFESVAIYIEMTPYSPFALTRAEWDIVKLREEINKLQSHIDHLRSLLRKRAEEEREKRGKKKESGVAYSSSSESP